MNYSPTVTWTCSLRMTILIDWQQWRIQKNLKGGIYQLRPHLSQMRTTKYIPFTRKNGFLKKYEPIGGGPLESATDWQWEKRTPIGLIKISLLRTWFCISIYQFVARIFSNRSCEGIMHRLMFRFLFEAWSVWGSRVALESWRQVANVQVCIVPPSLSTAQFKINCRKFAMHLNFRQCKLTTKDQTMAFKIHRLTSFSVINNPTQCLSCVIRRWACWIGDIG